MSRKLITVATPNCESGLADMVASARARGWEKDVIVNTPNTDWQPNIPGVKMRPRCPWYCDSAEVATCRNAPALIKPSAFLDNHDGDVICYVDGSDVVFMENPNALFDEFEASGALMSARPFRDGRKVGHDNQTIQMLVGPKLTSERGNYCNSGVILIRVCDLTNMAMWLWKAFLGLVPFAGPWKIGGPNNKLVGDQEPFNVVYRVLRNMNEKYVYDLGPEWNYRGSARVHSNLAVIHNQVFDENGNRVKLVHCSGLGEMPPEIVKASRMKGDPVQ